MEDLSKNIERYLYFRFIFQNRYFSWVKMLVKISVLPNCLGKSTILNVLVFSFSHVLVTHPGRLGAGYTGLGAKTLAPKKGFLTFYLKIFFKDPRRKVFRYSIYVIYKMFYKEI